jgi:transcriptional regulator with XRE-family HTH domain
MSEQQAIEGNERGLTEAQRESALRKPLTRFKRNRSKPGELEALRHKLIQARVTQGMMTIEAAEKFGYANSSQLSQIESGVRPTPSDWKFLRQAADVYAVSTDWLLGLSPNMEQDARVVREHALLRGSESIVRGFIAQMAEAIIQTARQTNVIEEELVRVLEDVDTLTARFERFAARPEFEDMPGGAPILAAVERLVASVAPMRVKLSKLQAVEATLAELKSGKLIPPERFTDFFAERDE